MSQCFFFLKHYYWYFILYRWELCCRSVRELFDDYFLHTVLKIKQYCLHISLCLYPTMRLIHLISSTPYVLCLTLQAAWKKASSTIYRPLQPAFDGIRSHGDVIQKVCGEKIKPLFKVSPDRHGVWSSSCRALMQVRQGEIQEFKTQE